MRGRLMRMLFGDEDRPTVKLLAVTPPRTGARTMLGVENMLASIAVPEPFALEITGSADGVGLMVRCHDRSVVKQQLGAHYPQALIDDLPPEEDPLRLRDGEQAWTTALRLDGPEFLPLRTFRDDDLLDQGSDPLIALVGALSGVEKGERVVAQLRLQSLGPDWSAPHRERALKRPESEPRLSSHVEQTRHLQTDGANMALLGITALTALRGYLWVQSGEVWKAVLLGLGVFAAVAVAGWVLWRIKKSRAASRMHDPILIKEKVSRIAFEAQLEATAILSSHGTEDRARELLDGVAAAYRHYDNAAGARFKIGKMRPALPVTELAPPGRGLFQSRNVLGVREAAALWHPPGADDETPLMERTGARVLLPTARDVQGGALVGSATAGRRREIYFPDDLLRRHHLYVARTRMGKSTLMRHVVAHRLREKAAGDNEDAIVVIDPHADLVSALIEQVPLEIVDRVRLIDLGDERRSPGINLLDSQAFPDRDRTADAVVRVAHGLWEQWGPRMQSILEHIVKSLHEANTQRDPGERYTILDGLRLLSDDAFRGGVLAQVRDPYLLGWWGRDFAGWSRQYRSEAMAPVQTRLSYYASSKRARAILGQPQSTIDVRKTVAEGGVLLVSTAQATAGRDVAALVGASLLHVVDAVVREQGMRPPEERRGALIVVDEMQSIPGVDYESMLSELGKFGASFILATQSLAKLGDLSPTMQDTLLANVGCLAVFQAAAADARQLVGELNRDRVSEEDIVSLPVHHCYVRATVGGSRLPTFSMAVREPEPGDREAAARIRAHAVGYTTPAETIAARERSNGRVEAFEQGLDDLGEDGAPSQEKKETGRRKQRSRRGRGSANPDAAAQGQ